MPRGIYKRNVENFKGEKNSNWKGGLSNTKEYRRRWKIKNIDKMRELQQRWYEKNKEVVKERRKIRYEKNKEREAETGRVWEKNHREQKNHTTTIRQMRLKKIEGTFTLKEW